MKYTIYTDGAYSQIHNEGAFAYVILNCENTEIERRAFKIKNETNNRAELKAIIAAVNRLPSDATEVDVYSDSEYALKTLSGEWSHRNNDDLFNVWSKVRKAKGYGITINYNWVKGHSGNVYNELCDQLCNDVLGYDANKEFEKFRKTKMPTINEEYALKIYNFVNNWKNGQYGTKTLQQSLDEYF